MNDVPDPASDPDPDPPGQPSVPPPPQPPQPPAAYPAGTYVQQTVVARQPKSGKATASLVLGICALATLVFCSWLITGFPPLVLGILAIVFGSMAKNEIDATPGLAGRGEAQAGFVLGIVTVGLCILFVTVVLLLVGGASLAA